MPGSTDPRFTGKKSRQPPSFRPTGKGLQNRLPNFAANAHNANGVLTNLAVPPRDEWQKLYAFVVGIETGWTLSGTTGQSPYSRSFFPHNLAQDELGITLAVANQYEYDRVVAFVNHHMRSMLGYAADGDSYIGPADFALDFKLFPFTYPRNKNQNQTKRLQPDARKVRVIHPGLHQIIVITDIPAGHERFVNAPLVNLTCKVVDDRKQKAYEVEAALWKKLTTNYLEVFGTIYDAKKTPKDANSTVEYDAQDANSWWLTDNEKQQAIDQHNHQA